MAIALKDLLSNALSRAHISKEVTLAQTIQAANDFLAQRVPGGRIEDVKATILEKGVLIVECKNSNASLWVLSQKKSLRDYVGGQVSTSTIYDVKTRLCS